MKKPESWLNSSSFLKRAFAIWGHAAVAHLIIGAAFFAVFLVGALLIGLAGLVIHS